MNDSKIKLRKIMDQPLDVICTVDHKSHFVDVGAASEAVWGYTPKELKEREIRLIDLVHKDDKEAILKAVQQIIADAKTSYLENRCIKKNGKVIPVLWSARWDDDDKLMYCIIRDMSKMKHQEQKMMNVSERYRFLVKATSDVIWDWDLKTGQLVRSGSFKDVYGGTDKRRFKSIEDWVVRIHPEEKTDVKNKMKKLLDDCNAQSWEITYHYLKTNNEYAFVLDRGYIIRDQNGTAVRLIGAMQDLTDYQNREKREYIFQKTLSELATNQLLADMKPLETLPRLLKASAHALKVNRVNAWLLEGNTARCIASYDAGEINKMQGYILKYEDFSTYFDELLANRTIASNKAREDPRLSELKSSYLEPYNVYSLLDTGVQIFGKAKAIVCHEMTERERVWKHDEIAFAGSITDQVAHLLDEDEKRIKEKKLRESLVEKELLLAEVHHRVKNNLALISGMIQLQAFEENDVFMKNKLMDWTTRVHSIAVIHEQLYQTENFAKVQLDNSLNILANKVVEVNYSGAHIELALKLDPVELNMNQALPCSIIVNEVLTNIIKHAFANQQKGKIWVILFQNKNQVHVIIKDNGKKLPSDFNIQVPKNSLGIKLISTLAKQLKAQYKYDSVENGTSFSLKFKKDKIRESSNNL